MTKLPKTEKPAPPLGNCVSFRATIPPIAHAIDCHGEAGYRLILEIAESDAGAFIPILALRNKRLKVVIEEHV